VAERLPGDDATPVNMFVTGQGPLVSGETLARDALCAWRPADA
jgi:hypothetical protein